VRKNVYFISLVGTLLREKLEIRLFTCQQQWEESKELN
jgi:hypothetical protein